MIHASSELGEKSGRPDLPPTLNKSGSPNFKNEAEADKRYWAFCREVMILSIFGFLALLFLVILGQFIKGAGWI
jgi:hypothetical protein